MVLRRRMEENRQAALQRKKLKQQQQGVPSQFPFSPSLSPAAPAAAAAVSVVPPSSVAPLPIVSEQRSVGQPFSPRLPQYMAQNDVRPWVDPYPPLRSQPNFNVALPAVSAFNNLPYQNGMRANPTPAGYNPYAAAIQAPPSAAHRHFIPAANTAPYSQSTQPAPGVMAPRLTHPTSASAVSGSISVQSLSDEMKR